MTFYGSKAWRELDHILRNLHSVENSRKEVFAAVRKWFANENTLRLLRDLGILSAGFLFAPEWRRTFEFFSSEVIGKTYKSPYIWSSNRAKDYQDQNNENKDLIHRLFLIVRETQKEATRLGAGIHREDFYSTLPSAEEPLNKLEPYRSKYGIHYCPIGELLFFLYAWRLLQWFVETDLGRNGRGFRPGKITKDSSNLPPYTWHRPTVLDGRVMERQEVAATFDLDEDIARQWSAALRKLNITSWKDEYEALLLWESDRPTFWVRTLECYLLDKQWIGQPLPTTSLEGLDEVLQNAVARLLADQGLDGNPGNAQLTALELCSRFPVLPFYFWNALDGVPKTYLVCPVWTSARYSVKREMITFNADTHSEEATPIVGLALCAVAPQRRLPDWTLPREVPLVAGLADAEARDLVELLTSLGRPLVELNFYGSLHDELLDLRRREAIAAIMARNLSHNIGSHVLADPKLYSITLDLVGKKLVPKVSKLAALHHYLQMRLDFIARTMSREPETGEPLFLLNDLMEGFYHQSALLQSLVRDAGFRGSKLKFILRHGDQRVETNWRKDKFSSKGKFDDLLVSVPGGPVGSQALYALLENIIRNSVKYGESRHNVHGTGPADELRLTLECADMQSAPDRYELTLYDSLSTDAQDKIVVNEILPELRKEPVDSIGRPTGARQGFQEMKTCARYLSGGVSKKDEVSQPNGNGPNGVDAVLAPPANGLTCQRLMRESKWYAAYRLSLRKPTLIGLIGVDHSPDATILPCARIRDLARTGAYFGLIVDDGNLDVNSTINEISRWHTSLPYRLMVATDDEHKWADAIREATGIEHGRLPIHRVRVIQKNALNFLERDSTGTTLASVLDVYSEWLAAYKGRPNGGWRLCIGFERNPEEIKARWDDQLKLFVRGDVQICVCAKTKDKQKPAPFFSQSMKASEGLDPCRWLEEDPGTTIVFDNHRKVFSDSQLPLTLACYHPFGSDWDAHFYQSLEAPPSDPFSFAFFIYGLVEGCLSRLAIVDERVAESAIAGQSIVGERQLDYIRAGILSLTSLHAPNPASAGGTRRFCSFALQEAASQTQPCSTCSADGNKPQRFCEVEGVHLIAPAKVCVAFAGREGKVVHQEQHEVDAVIIHEGVVDLLWKDGLWKQELDSELYSLTPRVLRTSGRGSLSRRLSFNLPFLEFSVVCGCTYVGFNKVRLARAVLSAHHPCLEADDVVDHPKRP